MPTVRIVSLGCPRNLVDSEVIAGSLKREGFRLTDASSADLCVINTCAFIDAARDEAYAAILEAADAKRRGRIGALAVCGCLPQLKKGVLAEEIPEIDAIIGTSDFPRLSAVVRSLAKRRGLAVSENPHYLYDDRSPRELSTPRHYAYLKIAEGCSNRCSYCIIPDLRGTFRSRSIPSLLREAAHIASGAPVKELVLIGQDTTQFGIDRRGTRDVALLIRRLAAMKNSVEWLRLLYTHPAHYSEDLIDVMAGEPKVCKYLDLPVQHVSDRILRLMNRRTTSDQVRRLIEKLRGRIPGLVLRTSIIVGFPGETEREFRELLSFVRQTRFERLGAFTYSRESSTPAARFGGHVSQKTKQSRLDRLLTLQREVSLAHNRRLIGTRMRVLVDEPSRTKKGLFIGRTQGDAPEIDNAVYVTGAPARPGEFCDVMITGASEYDLVGEAIA